MLTNLVSKELIQINVSADDWKSAIHLSAMPLLNHGKIKQSYIDGMIESVIESGPYFVLLPHVALSHTNYEKGALEDALGITVLNEAVPFGNIQNDPVKYIFTLSMTSSQKHIKALSVLAELFENVEFFKLLDEASNTDEIYDYIKKYTLKEE